MRLCIWDFLLYAYENITNLQLIVAPDVHDGMGARTLCRGA